MPIISTSLPSDGETIDAADVNTPFNDILDVVNGNIDSDNVAVGGLNYENFGTITGEIPASDMQDSGNIEKFRGEANVAFVASGCVWSTLTGLNGAMTAGVVYNADGVRNAPGAVASKTFTASRDTYVDIATNGAVSYSEVVNNDPSPALTANYVRIAKVVTSGSAITSITQSGVDSLSNAIFPTYTNQTGLRGAWMSWTPTWTNLTVGNGTLVYASYAQSGKTVDFRLKFTLGSTSSVSGLIGFSLPVTAKQTSALDVYNSMGQLNDATGNRHQALAFIGNGNRSDIYYNSGGVVIVVTSSTAPFTWTTNDQIMIAGTYEAA